MQIEKISHVDVIDWWPSAAELARQLGVKPQTVQKWRVRRNIPASYWPALIRVAKARKIRLSPDQLMGMAK